MTAQWLPNWNRGFAHVQRAELLALGLERMVADLSAAEFVSANGKTRQPLFDGAELSVTLPADGDRAEYAARPRNRPHRHDGRQKGRGAGAHARAFHAAAAQRRYPT